MITLYNLGLGPSSTVDVADTALYSGTVISYTEGPLRVQNSVVQSGFLQLEGNTCHLAGNDISMSTFIGNCVP